MAAATVYEMRVYTSLLSAFAVDHKLYYIVHIYMCMVHDVPCAANIEPQCIGLLRHEGAHSNQGKGAGRTKSNLVPSQCVPHTLRTYIHSVR